MIAVVGCGNASRSDDGVGPHVVRALAMRTACKDDRVRLLDAGTDGMGVMFVARGCQSLIIIDACRSGSPAGAVFEVPGGQIERAHEPSFTLHDFRWNHALFAARRIFREAFPKDVTVLLIEAETVDFGLELSREVAEAAEKVIERVEALVRSRLQTPECMQ